MTEITLENLPGLNCGLCGYRSCAEFAPRLKERPELIKRCIHLSNSACGSCGDCQTTPTTQYGATEWKDSLGREFDFYLEHFPEDPGPREVMIPHNPMLTRELNVQIGDILIGRPLGMSCGCPITHCGVVMEVDHKTGVIVWCVTGPLNPREKGFKDLGYYIAEAYEGIIRETRSEIKIGMRYFFQPKMCMLQWRHSGLVNYMNRTANGLQIRIEGLWIG
ncbi:(Fe-S)-binding protein [Bdellovibrionota bacterium FG-1]